MLKVKGVLDIFLLFSWGLGTALGARAGFISVLGMTIGALAARTAALAFGETAGRLLALALETTEFSPEIFSLLGYILVGSITFATFGFFATGAKLALRRFPLIHSIDVIGGALSGFLLAVFLTSQGCMALPHQIRQELVGNSYLLTWGKELLEKVVPWLESLKRLILGLFIG